jgi:hypothetical protein
MATVKKVGNRTLKVICDCKRKHTITATGEGDDMELEIFSTPFPVDDSKKDDKIDDKKKSSIFDFLAD